MHKHPTTIVLNTANEVWSFNTVHLIELEFYPELNSIRGNRNSNRFEFATSLM
jgi:hypothetical protein